MNTENGDFNQTEGRGHRGGRHHSLIGKVWRSVKGFFGGMWRAVREYEPKFEHFILGLGITTVVALYFSKK